jgi:hypothetical protein
MLERASPAVLSKHFSHPSWVMYSFANPLIILKLGHYVGGGQGIANHLNESLWWTNQKKGAEKQLVFLQVHSFTAPFPNHGQNHFPEPNQHTLDFLHPFLLRRITYRAPLEMLFQLQKQKQLQPFPVGGHRRRVCVCVPLNQNQRITC